MVQFIELTRVYVLKEDVAAAKKAKAKTVALKQGPILVQAAMVTSVRASNRLGYPEHRATITLADGRIFDIAEKYSVVKKALGVR